MVQNESPPCPPGFGHTLIFWTCNGCSMRARRNFRIVFDSCLRWVWSQQCLWYRRFWNSISFHGSVRLDSTSPFSSTDAAIPNTTLSNSWIEVGTPRSCANKVVWYRPKHCGFHILFFFWRLFWLCFGNSTPVYTARWSEPKSNLFVAKDVDKVKVTEHEMKSIFLVIPI